MKNLYKFLLLALLATGQAGAQQFAIHLDTSKSPDTAALEELSIYGELSTVKNSDGYTTTLLGPYEGNNIAKEILNEIRVAGYEKAFITAHKTNNINASISGAAKYQYSIANFDVKRLLDKKTLSLWNTLTLEQQASITYFDGALHIKDGYKFVTLKELARNKVVSYLD